VGRRSGADALCSAGRSESAAFAFTCS